MGSLRSEAPEARRRHRDKVTRLAIAANRVEAIAILERKKKEKERSESNI